VSWGRLPVIRAHRARILRLLQNLISNAIKYARPGVPAVIRISAVRESKGEWRIDVADNGAGIAPEYLEKVFAPLARLHGPEIAGTGLGLAICKRVVEGEGGRIWVDSVVGEGSTFHIVLPAHTPVDFAQSA
jgi:signal transduction histidine kinase